MVQDGFDVLVLDLAPRSVRAEQYLVALLQVHAGVDVHVALGTHGPQQDVAVGWVVPPPR